jgi:hypothetical protein
MAESFFQRWTRRKSEAAQARATEAVPRQAGDPPTPGDETATPAALPTLRDVGLLDANSDYSAYIAKNVDTAVRRAAMKKLFSDPHFNVMDGLDIYIDDYTKPQPLTAAMLAAISHAKSTLDPQRLFEPGPDAPEQVAQQPAGAAPAIPPVEQPAPQTDAAHSNPEPASIGAEEPQAGTPSSAADRQDGEDGMQQPPAITP